ncbi:acetylcholinesterase-1-like isoform X3 [Ornithodoros turicata]|uniref:acetylcholinesterase-1-like isoform X3 n=1 Tax=Ornithodoros turicata TaxID=34597 RepID=UPI003138E010
MNHLAFGVLLGIALLPCDYAVPYGGRAIVQTKSGPVLGKRFEYKGKVVDAFYGIPFAEPPIGKLRFRKPEPVQPWSGTYDATEKKSPCLQMSVYAGRHGSPGNINNSHSDEDCLYLNVWRPASCEGGCKDLPVFIFLFGGSFAIGDGGFFMYDGLNFVASTDVVYVTLNYRLGLFGFLYAGTDEAPGNVGLFDQLMALKWVKDNIKSFGGNPEEITLGGQSAGGVSVGFHMMSPLSKGLFKRAILESGTPLTISGAFPINGIGQLLSLASVFDCYNVSWSSLLQVNSMVKCLRKIEGRKLLDEASSALGFKSFLFFPRVGGDFIPFNPSEDRSYALNAEEVIIGETSNEGGFFAYSMYQRFHGDTSYFEDNLKVAMRVALMGYLHMDTRSANTVIEGYLGSRERISREELQQVVSETFADFFFYCPADIFSDVLEERRIPVHRYLFDYKPRHSGFGNFSDTPVHTEDIPFFRGVLETEKSEFLKYSLGSDVEAFRNFTITPEELTFSQELVQLWASFMKNGKPKIPKTDKEWPKYTKENKAYLILKPNDYKVAHGPRSTKCHLWEPYLVKRKATTPHPTPAQKPRPTPKRGHEKRPKIKVQQLDNNIAAASRASATVVEAATFVLAAVTVLLTTREL